MMRLGYWWVEGRYSFHMERNMLVRAIEHPDVEESSEEKSSEEKYSTGEDLQFDSDGNIVDSSLGNSPESESEDEEEEGRK
jgi:hypothetical protein